MPIIDQKKKHNLIPEYSLTGDLLNYLRCNKQYRYQKRANWHSTNPVQIWMGEFLHKMMARGYHLYLKNPDKRMNSYDWESDLRPLELEIFRQLSAVGIRPPGYQFCRYDRNEENARGCDDENHPHKTLPSQRAEQAIKIVGEMIYPFIFAIEQKLKGVLPLPEYNPDTDRSSSYGLTGVVDVISAVNIYNAPTDSLLVDKIMNAISELTDHEFEIIIDYKGSRRPTTNISKDGTGQYHEWQIKEYAWLRKLQNDNKPVRIGIIVYINELAPSSRDIRQLKYEIINGETDIMPENPIDKKAILNYPGTGTLPNISTNFKSKRALKIFQIDETLITEALANFDSVVRSIETNINREIRTTNPLDVWVGSPKAEKCTLCNLKTFCSDLDNNEHIARDVGVEPQVPPQI